MQAAAVKHRLAKIGDREVHIGQERLIKPSAAQLRVGEIELVEARLGEHRSVQGKPAEIGLLMVSQIASAEHSTHLAQIQRGQQLSALTVERCIAATEQRPELLDVLGGQSLHLARRYRASTAGPQRDLSVR